MQLAWTSNDSNCNTITIAVLIHGLEFCIANSKDQQELQKLFPHKLVLKAFLVLKFLLIMLSTFDLKNTIFYLNSEGSEIKIQCDDRQFQK